MQQAARDPSAFPVAFTAYPRFVATELPTMPHPADFAQRLDLVTTDFSSGRLIGDRKAVDEKTKTFDRIVIDQGDSLARWAELLQGVRGRVQDVYVFANNHFAGHGPATIRDLIERLDGSDGSDRPDRPNR